MAVVAAQIDADALALLAPFSAFAEETWREPLTGIEFVRMPAGCYVMGDTFGKGEANEQPPHEVCLKSFWIGRHEVTQGEWQKAVSHNPSVYLGDERLPVDSVNQMDIAAFIFRLGEANPGRRFRLPTEAEWEYACRAAGQQEMFGGQAPPGGANTAEYADRHGEGTLPVGSFPPNDYGLFDMAGNVWEWTASRYAYPWDGSEQRDAGLLDQSPRVVRGGAWNSGPTYLRSSQRDMKQPQHKDYALGFRVLRELP